VVQHAESEMMSAKLRGSEMEEVGCELSLGSTEADVVDYVKDESFWKGKRYYGRRPPAEDLDDNLDDVREACSGTEEGQKLDAVKELFEMEVADTKLVRSSKGSRKRSKKVLFGEGMAVISSKPSSPVLYLFFSHSFMSRNPLICLKVAFLAVFSLSFLWNISWLCKLAVYSLVSINISCMTFCSLMLLLFGRF